MALQAYIRQRERRVDKPLPDGVFECWERCEDEKTIMEAAHEDLIFTEEMDVDDVLLHFENMYPVSQIGLTRIKAEPGSTWRTDWRRGDGYPKRILAFEYEWYDGDDAEEVSALAKTAKDHVVVYSVDPRPFESTKWPDEEVYSTARLRYVRCGSALEEYDCYQRTRTTVLAGKERRVREVVYNPKLVKRRIARREQREKGYKDGRGLAEYTGYIKCEEFNKVIRQFNEMLPYSRVYEKPDSFNQRRWNTAWAFRKAIELMWLVFGPTSHRQSSEFMLLVEQWRTRADVSRDAWESDAGDITRMLDEEVAHLDRLKRKPRKRELKTVKTLYDLRR